jgi:predicted site-specific integrase-resolvase
VKAENVGFQLWDRVEVAKRGSVSVRTVAEWMKRGLPYLKISPRQVRFVSSDVEAFLAKYRIGASK